MKKWVKIAIGAGIILCLCVVGVALFIAYGGKDPATPLVQLSPETKLRILHFGDVYDIQEDDGKGGAARFVTALDHYRNEAKGAEILTLFSGDMLAPSLISTVKQGQQMVLPFNSMKVDAACIGNHEFDFGIEGMAKVIG